MAEAKKNAKKPGTEAAEEAKTKEPKVVEQADVSVETDITEAAIDAAQQATAVIAEKRSTKPVAKAGKRSAKSIAEAEEKQAKEERKAQSSDESPAAPKPAAKPARSRLERRSKKFRKAAELIEAGKTYTLAQALELATKTSPVKFDATVELHIRLNVDPRQADQNIRDTIVLPAGTGKTVRIAVLADVDGVAAAKKAGADIAGSEEFLQQLDKGQFDFDVLIATPAMMPKLGKYARALGPKGLMPNPKSGTVTNDVAKAVADAKAGRVEYRVDSTGIIHVGIGKVSFGPDKLGQNAKALIDSVKASRPSSIKGAYLKSAYATTSMGPSILIDSSEF